jgi:plastocyanin
MSLARRIRPAGLLLIAAACSSAPAGNNDPNDDGNNQNPPTNPGGTPVTSAEVVVGNNYFDPNSVLLAVGGTVTWTWIGSGHSVTSNGTPTFSPNAPVSNAPRTLIVTFSTAGDYRYLCTVHGVASGYTSGAMVGEIFVR